MTRNLTLALAAAAALAAPLAAQAQSTSTVTITGDVEKACAIGQPSEVTLNLGDLTGPDGRISEGRASAETSATTSIPVAWCNAPSRLSLDSSPLALSPTPGYGTPDGFARLVTYDATLSGWTAPVIDRPVVGDSAKTIDADGPYATDSLTLAISALEALNAAGGAANAEAVLEAGSYSGSVVVSVAVQ